MATISRENLGLLNDKLTITLEQSDYLPAFEKKLKEFGKTANIPGFRKGMVPVGMIKKMYGNSIFTEEILRAVDSELINYLTNEKPDIFGQPLPIQDANLKLDMNQPSTYQFSFEIGLKPTFETPSLDKASLTFHEVEITEEMMNDEIERMRIKAGVMTEPETVETGDNVLNVTMIEADKDGNAVEGGIKKDNSVMVKYFTEAVQKELMGKKKGESILVEIGNAFEGEKLEMMMKDLGLETSDKFFQIQIDKVGLVTKRPMEADFFNEVFPGQDLKDEAAFRDALKADLKKYWDSRSKNQLYDQLYHFLLDNTTMEFPESFLKKWLQTSGEQAKTEEQVESEFPVFKNQLKWTLITDKLMKDNNIDVSHEELRNHMRNEVMGYFGGMMVGNDMSWLDSYIDRMMKDQKQVESTYHRVMTEKLFAALADKSNPVKKTVSAEQLADMEHHHEH